MNRIRKGYIYKIISVYLSLSLILPGTTFSAYGLTSGPSQPEFNSFTPISTSDMVNLSSGDFNYNIPLMDVGGYPINIAYDSGITMDQEASWVGLGWNLNIGQINRQVRGLPDDFNGDEMTYENNMKDNITYGTNVHIQPAIFGSDFPVNVGIGLGVEWNNYEGISFHPSAGVTYSMSDNVSVGLNLSSSTAGGANVSPSVTFSDKNKFMDSNWVNNTNSLNVGVSMNSRQGLNSLSIGLSSSLTNELAWNRKKAEFETAGGNGHSVSGSISFIDNTFTPSKRVAQKNQNISFSAGFGTSFWGVETDVRITGYGSKQGIESSEKNKKEKAYGYEFTEQNNDGILDFNREKDRSVSKNTTMLPITNYTYDIYSIQGQGIGGMFRPFRSQVSHVYDKKITDKGNGGSIGVEIAPGAYFHGGVDVKINKSTSYTGLWDANNFTKTIFDESKSGSEKLNYEKVYFRIIGELDVDPESEILNTQLHGDAPIKIGIGGGKYNRKAAREFLVKNIDANGKVTHPSSPINTKIKRKKRQLRNKSIQKITNKEAKDYKDNFIEVNPNAESHHTVGMKVLNENGSTYVYGKAAYNTKKIEATFTVNAQGDCNTGLVSYASNENTSGNSSGIDQFYNKIHTPAYAHTYLLTTVLSSDYEDLTGDGPTDDDLGSYTKFSYNQKESNYKWRVPYLENTASYNEGLKSLDKDQKGNYIYGEKELLYIDKIETKTHVAIFQLSTREDARGVKGENGGGDGTSGHMFKINKISLYSKPEYKANSSTAVPIKEVHFEYDYSLVQGVPNNLNGGGKLTLKKIYFTYQNSKMGKYTPYQFNYEQTDANGDVLPEADYNPQYNLKGYDIWGNYKENTAIGCDINSAITTAEFPFVEQQDKDIADKNASMWSLVSIDLPSGGKLELDYESDDYQFVQNRRAMQMFKVTGAGRGKSPGNNNVINNNLYNNDNKHDRFLYVKIPNSFKEDDNNDDDEALFIEQYLGDQINEPIYFRFLLNMVKNTSWQYDYVSGYFTIATDKPNSINIFEVNSGVNQGSYAAIRMGYLKKEGGWVTSNQNVNPISKAGWYFGRKYLNRVVYSLGGDAVNDDLGSAMNDLVSSIGGVVEIFKGPNDRLQQKQCAKEFVRGKSWIRLLNPDKRKFGGGVRIKKLVMHDKWDEMTGNLSNSLYKQQYGQIYSYTKEDGTSSGVATFEPNMSKENPFVEPFYDKEGDSKKDKLVAPKEDNFVEKPIGESFFPAPTVTYSRVEVKNLERKEGTREVKKHATGSVVNEFYTSYDFPTIADYTDVTSNYDKPTTLGSLLRINVRNHLTMSQGFVVHTNDMNGKLKSQRIYAEGQNSAISGVDYKYNIDENNKLNNKLTTIDRDGKISKETVIGVHYDVVNDFRESYSKSTMIGANVNVNVFPVVFFPLTIVTVFPAIAKHENILRMATTTKVIHSTGILKEKIAYDLGSKVSTENLAWNAETGQVLLTKTVNEYDDAYFNLNYPSHWYYDNMSEASKNLDIQSTFKNIADTPYFSIDEVGVNPKDFLTVGDEVFTYITNNNNNKVANEKLWVVDFEDVEVPGEIIDSNYNSSPYRLMAFSCASNAGGGVAFYVVLEISNHPTLPDGLYNIRPSTNSSVIDKNNFDSGNLPCEIAIGSDNYLGTDPTDFYNSLGAACGTSGQISIVNVSYQGCSPMVNDIDNVSTTIVEGVQLINRDGKIINGCPGFDIMDNLDFKIVRSGYRNLQTASMASVTSMVNPIDTDNDGTLEGSISGIYENTGIDYRIVNSSAIEYSDVWKTQCENVFNDFNEAEFFAPDGDVIDPQKLWFNPYLYNVKGDWRAKKSYAYLTGRKADNASTSPRNDGFYTGFNPFYEVNGQNWTKNTSNWTFASEVTQYSPYGVEVENKDALGRYSSAQYGYNYTLPTAVASNSEYKEIGFDGFEDYEFKTTDDNTSLNRHFGYQDMLDDNISINSKNSHTGKNSIAVASNSSVTLQKHLLECAAPDPLNCPIPMPINLVNETCNQNGSISACTKEYEFDLSFIPEGEMINLFGDMFLSISILNNNQSEYVKAAFVILKDGADVASHEFTDVNEHIYEETFSINVTNANSLKIILSTENTDNSAATIFVNTLSASFTDGTRAVFTGDAGLMIIVSQDCCSSN